MDHLLISVIFALVVLRLLTPLGATRWWAVTALLLTSILVGSCGVRAIVEVRYRVTVTLDVRGSERSASAVQGLRYRWGGTVSWQPTIYGDMMGSAPVLDLGEDGWLVAAISNDFTDTEGWADRLKGYSTWKYRNGAASQSCGYATSFARMFQETTGVKNDADDEAALRRSVAAIKKGPQEVTQPRLPAFIWVPRNAPIRSGVQLCPEEFERVIGAKIELKSVTVEVVPNKTPIDHEIADPVPPWLAELRRDNALKPGKIPNDSYHRYRQVERGDWW